MSSLQLVFKQAENNVLMTDSRRLAEGFGVEHKNVLQKIERILAETEESFRVLNFQQAEETVIQSSNGAVHKFPIYRMTRDGFMFIARTFTGKKGNAFAIKVIEMFNHMESMLKSHNMQVPTDLLGLAEFNLNGWKQERVLRLAAESEVKEQQDTAVTLAMDYAQPASAYMKEFPILEKKALELYRNCKNKRDRLLPSGMLTMWLRETYGLNSLKRNVKGQKPTHTVCVYNRADILKVVKDLEGAKSE